jgi:membrane-associated protein
MDLLHKFLDLFLHLDKHLADVVGQYGPGVYLLLFLIVFCETGLVVTPILPGDSLLFAAGAVAALPDSPLHPQFLIPLLIVAALLGDNMNYFVGCAIGPRLFNRPKSLFFNPAHLHRTREFYEHHGGQTIILARFIPIIRTCAPFVAGMGAMRYRRFILFCIAGACLWVPIGVLAGYLLGEQPFVKSHFSVIILAIVGISLLPPAMEFIRARQKARRANAAP